eukprot:11448299-Ditylum_brightwellii.AAC.1
MLTGKLREAVRTATDRRTRGILFPANLCTKTGAPVLEVLEGKHPTTRVPPGGSGLHDVQVVQSSSSCTAIGLFQQGHSLGGSTPCWICRAHRDRGNGGAQLATALWCHVGDAEGGDGRMGQLDGQHITILDSLQGPHGLQAGGIREKPWGTPGGAWGDPAVITRQDSNQEGQRAGKDCM